MADERGSVVSITDSAGATIHINAYDEYGIPAPGNLGRFGYTGQTWLPELGMWYYKARMYSPTLGRFLQTDPIGYRDGMNWYNYVGGDPVNFGDPTGTLMTCTGSIIPQDSCDGGASRLDTYGTWYCLDCHNFGVEGRDAGGSYIGITRPTYVFVPWISSGWYLGNAGFNLADFGRDEPQRPKPEAPKNCTVSRGDSTASGGLAAATAAIPEYPNLAAKFLSTGLRSTILGAGEEAAATGGVEGVIAQLGGPVTLGAVAIGTGVYAYDRYSGGAVTKFLNRTSDKLGAGIKIGNGCE